ncbi:serine/threonine-protein kinase [Streptomyces dysideae]|uniref:serine/threonine-protein kinase n=1 Tax=Streptomyces dysideae TaxID=909626 RepID=UPI000B2F435B
MSNDGAGAGRKGRVVGGRYRLAERIGSGGMGTVWRAVDELVEREVAVKQPRLPGDPEDESHQRAAHRLYREARAAARVDHPAAVAIHDVVVEEDGLPWIVMELVRGESLHEMLQRGPLAPAESARIGRAVLGALGAAHAVGIVHRDVKPANVLLGAHDRVVLTDFGIAHIQGEESLTMSGEFVGSLEFIAPERMSGRGAGPASDLWSLGVLLYAAVEGWSPFRRTTLESTLAAILSADPPEPKQAGPLGPLIVRLLEKDPERRPGAADVDAVLEAVAEGWPVPDSAGEGGTEPEPQDAVGLRELGEDVGTVRLGGDDPAPEPTPRPGDGQIPEPDTVSPPSAKPKKPSRFLLRPLPVAALGVALVAGTWFAASAFITDRDDGLTEMNPTYTSVPAVVDPTLAPTADSWQTHRETEMDAVLALPAEYEEFAREGSASDPPRLVVYGFEETIQVRLTHGTRRPAPPRPRRRRRTRPGTATTATRRRTTPTRASTATTRSSPTPPTTWRRTPPGSCS